MKKVRITEQDLYEIIRESVEMVLEDGAASCGSVMGSGAGLSDGTTSSDGSNPSAGYYDAPMGTIKKGFYTDTLKRNKDEKNGSISMNRKK